MRRYLRVSLRRRTRARLDLVEKAPYRCGLWVAKVRGTITSVKLSVSILGIIARLVTTIRNRVYSLGFASSGRLDELLASCSLRLGS